MEAMDLTIEGMSCEHCVGRVKKALEGVGGVAEADVKLDPGRATVRGEGYRMEDLVEAVDRVGYTARAS
jgi:copper chaperone CopZ